MNRPFLPSLTLLVLSSAGCGSVTCEEVERATSVDIPEDCSEGRCEHWRTAPCAETCAAFVPENAKEVTTCTGPERRETTDGAFVVHVECRYVAETCASGKGLVSLGSGRPQRDHRFRGPERRGNAIGDWLAALAEAEESSVHAFVELAAVLEELGAPRALLEGCLRAAEDEERHRQVMTDLARREGAEPSRANACATRWGSVLDLARENVVKGCVEELFSAALIVYASRFARDEVIRQALASVAEDEARHAELAFAIDDFLGQRLRPRERVLVSAARDVAVDSLRAPRLRADDAVVRAGLLPEPERWTRLVDALFLEVGRCAA